MNLSVMIKKGYEYFSHDYSAVNRHVDEVFRREHEHTRVKNALSSREYIKNFLIAATGVVIVAILAVAGYKLFLYKFTPVLENEKHKEDRIIKVPDASISKVIEKPIIVEKPVVVPIEIPSEESTVTNFTIFIEKKVDGEIDGIEEVITGANFPSSDVKYPTYQWCYTVNPRNNVSSAQIKLAIKEGRGTVQWLDISGDDAQQYGSTVQNLDAAKKFCAFVFEQAKDIPEDIPKDSIHNKSGTGFFVNDEGYMVTNEHVVSGCETIWIDSKEMTPAVLVGADVEDDIAILKVDQDNVAYAKFSGEVATGQDVIAIGYPLGDQLGTQLKVTKGNISAMEGIKGDGRHLQFTAPIQSGNSGGPLVNESGLIAGVNTATLRGEQFQNINFAIKGTLVQSFLGKNRVSFTIDDGSQEEMRVEEIVQQAENHTRQIKCF